MSAAPDVQAAAAFVRGRLPFVPDAAIVLGSGLGHLADRVEDPVSIPFGEIPGFPRTSVVGHAGRFVAGRLGDRNVLLQAGRYHVYEGHPGEIVAAPVRLAATVGVRFLLLTNAAGAVDPKLAPGDVVLLSDHLNFMFRSPLIGPVAPGETRFPDMTEPYDRELRVLAMEVARREGLPLTEGVYAAMTGPTFETAAEIRMLGRLGAHVVGMSTVPEVLVARALGLRCLGLSMVTNKGTGLSEEPLSHQDVVDVGERAGKKVGRILEGLLRSLPGAPSQSTGAK
ncbi:MAG TPA: purine-nucleoside phosphorylase [Longimicrobiales bacterium]|nr:purine-nucleoside phosphorylase [Longimicrobiales bacterium]